MISSNQNYIDDKLEVEYAKLSDSELRNIADKNINANNRSDKISLLSYSTLAGLLVTSKPVTGVLERIGAENLSKMMESDSYFAAYVLAGSLATLGYWIYGMTGGGYQESQRFNTALNVLEKREEAVKLAEQYLKPAV